MLVITNYSIYSNRANFSGRTSFKSPPQLHSFKKNSVEEMGASLKRAPVLGKIYSGIVFGLISLAIPAVVAVMTAINGSSKIETPQTENFPQNTESQTTKEGLKDIQKSYEEAHLNKIDEKIALLPEEDRKAVMAPNGTEIARSDWSANVRVLAPNGQKAPIYGGYTRALLSEIEEGGAPSIEAANDVLSKKGWKEGHFATAYPLETSGERLNIWNKKTTDKNRFILVINSEDTSDFKYTTTYFLEKIENIYQVPKGNIINCPPATTEKELSSCIEKMGKKLAESKAPNKAELLVYYNGHGGVFESGAPNIEGSHTGLIQLSSHTEKGKSTTGLTENYFKMMFQQNFGNVLTLFIANMCHSGAWIADNASYQKGLNRLA